MVVRARPSIRRKIQGSSTLRTTINDWKNAHCLLPISTTDAGYVGPTLIVIFYSLIYALILAFFILVIQSLKFSYTQLLAPVFVLSSAVIFSVTYSLCFNDYYTGKVYYSIGMYQTVYIWLLWVVNSILNSILEHPFVLHAFSTICAITYSMLSTYFIDNHFKDKYRILGERSHFIYRTIFGLGNLFFSILFLAFLTPSNLFKLY